MCLINFLQAFFHFRTIALPKDGASSDNEEQNILDDSRTLGTGPFELLVGREFKLGIWEDMVKTMRVGEVARFECPFKVYVYTCEDIWVISEECLLTARD